jgi:putative SOS response-associated peptidase YedK
VPYWAKDRNIADKLIKAKAETLADKSPFHDAYRKPRCLIPAGGFFEWQRRGPVKQPYYPATIDTTTANHVLSGLHARLPLIIAPEQRNTRLRPGNYPTNAPHFVKAGG